MAVEFYQLSQKLMRCLYEQMNQYIQQFLSVILDKTFEEFFKFYHNFPSPQAKRNYIISRKYFNAVSTLLLG